MFHYSYFKLKYIYCHISNFNKFPPTDDDGDDSQTEGEELKRAREMRREEVRLMPIPTNLPTDTETEVSDSPNLS